MRQNSVANERGSASPSAVTLDHLKSLEQRLLWLACWTVQNANHLRPREDDDVKVGGH